MSIAPDQPPPVPLVRGPADGLRRRLAAFISQSNLGDRVFKGVCVTAALLILGLAGLLAWILIQHSWLSIRTTGLGFFLEDDWDPEPDHRVFGAVTFIYGTMVTSALAMLIAVPLGVGTAAFLSEVAPGWLRRSVSFLVEMLAAIPSVVYGLWGMFVLAPLVQPWVTALGGPNTGGRGILTASLVLSIMVVPYVTAVSYDVCRAVPSSQRQAALALGATRWQMIWSAVLPYARPGIVAASFIALGRALGETMAVTMLIGNKDVWPFSNVSGPEKYLLGDSIASRIANQFTEATYDLFRSALMELGLVLLAVSVAVNLLARLLIWRIGRVRRVEPWWRRWLRGASSQRVTSADAVRFGPPRGSSNRWARRVNRIMTWALGGCVAVTVGPLFFILGYLVYMGLGALDWAFFTQVHVPVGEPGGGMAHALYGSAILVGLATAFAVPIGVFAAIYLAEYRNGRLAHSLRLIGELLGGVPSIVIGIFAYHVIVMPMIAATDGQVRFSAWAGSFALGVMMLPIVMRASEEALKLVPRNIRQASLALGASHWQTVVRITVPAALPAMITAVCLAVARIAGETAPLLLTATDYRTFPSSPSDPTPSVPVLIYKYSISPYPDWHRKAWAAALVLMVVIMLLNFGIRRLAGQRVIAASRAD